MYLHSSSNIMLRKSISSFFFEIKIKKVLGKKKGHFILNQYKKIRKYSEV